MDFDKEREWVYRQSYRYRNVPPAAYFKSFNNNSKTVKKEYEAAYKQITSTFPLLSSVFYKEGGSLIADKDFAGHPAGENLLPYVFEDKMYIKLFALGKEMFGSVLDDGRLDADYLLAWSGMFYYPIGDCEVFEDDITFTLDLPVKVGLFLEWLNDRISDPDADMPYREETLHGTWTLGQSLRPKQ
ncbi:MAG: hypothetical protein IJ721_05265 [Bacteroidales bacterium]|nr:hypothetical protein [Bacteroidales bacterium]